MRATSTSSNVRAEALDPPAVAGRAVRAPVVERVAPVLAVRAQRVGRRAGDLAVREELRPRRDVGARVGDVDRDVADQPDAALARVGAQRLPLALEAHLVGERARAGEARPVADPVRVARDEVLDLVGSRPAPSGSASSAGEPANAEAARYGEPNSSGGPSGSICHHDWPAAASQSTKRYASSPSRPPGSEVGWSRIPDERGSCTVPILAQIVETLDADVPLPKTTEPPPRIQIQRRDAAGRLRPLSR